MHLEELYLRLARGRFHTLKFILEGYDGLAQLSSAGNKGALVRLRYPYQRRGELFDLLAALAPQLRPAPSLETTS